MRLIPGSDELAKHSISRNPFRRLTTPEDVANVVYLMAKDESAWINGTTIRVDGGEHLQ
jgi:enoyl-[acyl-carrier protein] reductase I